MIRLRDPFDRSFELLDRTRHTDRRIIGLDHKFAYIEHTLYARGAPAANVMCRSVIVAKGKIVPPRDVAEEMGHADWNPDLPDWVRRWAEADDLRPWPPAPMA